MSDEPKVVLNFLTNDQHQIQLARDYWTGSDDGRGWKWAETVQSIAERYGLLKHYVASAVREIARAHDPDIRCSDCSAPREIESRAALKPTFGEYVCRECNAARVQFRNQELREKRMRLAEKQNAIVADVSSRGHAIDYTSIEYFDAVVLYAIMLASDEACEKGTFDDAYSLRLCPGENLARELLNRLFSRNILQFSSDTPSSAIVLGEDEHWRYKPYEVKWRVSPDAGGATFPQIFAEIGNLIDLRTGHPSYERSVADLWWSLGFNDALNFLDQEVATYRITDYRKGPKTDEALRYALERFSIPQVRREIRSVVKNAAALSISRDFNRRHALNTIPGNLISYVDRALSEHWTVHPVLSDWQNDEPVLTTVLFDRVLGSGLTGFRSTNGAILGSPVLQI